MTIRDIILANGDAVEAYVSPDDLTSEPGNTSNLYLSKKNCVSDSMPPKYFCIHSAKTADIDIVWVQSGTVVKSQTESCVPGLNVFAIDNIGTTGESIIGVKQHVSKTLKVRTTGGDSTILVGSSEVQSTFKMGFWVGYDPEAMNEPNSTGLQLKASNEIDIRLECDYTIESGVFLDKVSNFDGGGFRLIPTGLLSLVAHEKEDLRIQNLTISGDNSTDTNIGPSSDSDIQNLVGLPSKPETGIKVSGNCSKIVLDKITVEGINGFGFDLDNELVDSGRGAVTLNNCNAEDCFVGLRFGERDEYNIASNFRAWNNTIGMVWQGGNNNINTMNLSANRINLAILSGANDSHSSGVGLLLNHAKKWNIWCGEISYGIVIAGSQIHSGKSRISGSKGFTFANSCINQEFETENVISGLFQGNCVTNLTFTETGTGSTILQNNNYSLNTGGLV